MKRFHPLLASTFSAFLTFSVASQSANTDENLATIAEQYRQLAEQGDMKAQSQLGYLYYVGEGVPQSYADAVNCIARRQHKAIKMLSTIWPWPMPLVKVPNRIWHRRLCGIEERAEQGI